MSGIKIITANKKAHHDFSVIEKYEAGIQLVGTELKPLRNNQCNLKDSYCDFIKDELFLLGVHISPFNAASYNNHVPERKRKLLMKRHELDRIHGKVKEKGLSVVPLKMYFKAGKVKVEIALVKGKNHGDKRESIKKRQSDRMLDRHLKRSKR